jgi:hypothetical protein
MLHASAANPIFGTAAIVNGTRQPRVTEVNRISPSVMLAILGGDFPNTTSCWFHNYCRSRKQIKHVTIEEVLACG